MRMRKKKWTAAFLQEEQEYLIEDGLCIPDDQPVYLEIGMGMGDFIVESAKENPGIFYIGLEREETCVARAVKKAREAGVENMRILFKDAREIDLLFKEKSIDRIYLPFSDPWPKKRNHKRRLTYPTFFEKYAKILKDDGSILFKSDNDSLFEDTLEYLKESPFEAVEVHEDHHSEKREEVLTAYERKFIAEGHPIHFVEMRKK